jgi:hypothetical protein
MHGRPGWVAEMLSADEAADLIEIIASRTGPCGIRQSVYVFQFERPDGVAVELVVTLLDTQSDKIAISKMVRDHGAQAFGMLFFKSASLPCPKEAVIWECFEDGLQITPADDDAYLFNESLQNMCLQAVKTFLEDTAQEDPKYHWLGPPTVN